MLPQPGTVMSHPPIILKRLFRFSHMDFEHAIWELGMLLVVPRKVYRQVYYHKQTKDTWARDDPALLILLCAMILFSGISWSIIKHYSVLQSIGLCLTMLLRDFLLCSLLAASAIWLLTNTFLTSRGLHSPKLEWAYAFDLHCNGFVAIFSWLYVTQLFLLPLITGQKWISLFVGNTIYFVAIVQYFYIVYLGLSALPFLRRANLFLVPLLLLLIGYIICLSGYSIPQFVLHAYFK